MVPNSNVWQPTNVNYPNGHTSMGTDRQGCLHCHSTGRMEATAGANKMRYLLHGHRNMLRKIDGSVSGTNAGGAAFTSNNSDADLGFPSGVTGLGSAAYTGLTGVKYIYGGWYRNVKEARLREQPAPRLSLRR